MASQIVEIFYKVRDEASGALKNINSGMDKFSKTILSAKTLVGGLITGGIARLGGSFLKAAADLEQYTVSFSTMLGSQEKAKKLLEEINKVAVATPFTQTDIIGATQQLLAFGVANEKVIDTFKVLGDISQGNKEKLDGLVAAYGKVQAKGVASMEEIKMVAEKGVPIIDQLAKTMGVSKEEVFKLASQGKISAGIFNEAMTSMTTKGGMFYQSMIKQSTTFSGLMSTVQGNIQLVSQKIGEILLPIAKSLAIAMNNLFNVFFNLSPGIQKFIAVMVILTGVFIGMLPFAGMLATAMAAISWPVFAVAAAVGVAIAAFVAFKDQIGAAINFVKNLFISYLQFQLAGIRLLIAGIDALINKFNALAKRIPGIPMIDLGTDTALEKIDELNQKLEDSKSLNGGGNEEEKQAELESINEHEGNKTLLMDQHEQARLEKIKEARKKQDELNKKSADAYIDNVVQAAQQEQDIGKAAAQGALQFVKDQLLAEVKARAAKLAAEGFAELPLLAVGNPSGPLKLAAAGAITAAGTSAINAIKLAQGGQFDLNQPTSIGPGIVAGEAGPERVTVTPLDKQGGGEERVIILDADGVTELAKGTYKRQRALLNTGELS